PVVQMMPNQIEAEPEFVRAVGVGHVVAVRPAFFDAGHRHPVRNTKAVIAARSDIREAALADVRPVRIRNAELQTVVGSKIAWDHRLALALITKDTIEDHVRTERVGVADRANLNQGVSDTGIRAAKTRSAGNSEDRP